MARRPPKKTLTTPKPTRRVANKKPVSSLQSVIWETPEGETFTRRQLSNKLSRANYKLKQAEKYMSAKGYEKLQKDYADVVGTAYRSAGRIVAGAGQPLPARYQDQKIFTLKGITDARVMRALNDAADRILSWERMTKSGYDVLRANAVVAQMQKFNLSEEDAEMLVDLYDSDDWDDFHAAIAYASGMVMEEFMQAFEEGEVTVNQFGDMIREMVKQHKDSISDPNVPDPFEDPVSWIYAALHGDKYEPDEDGGFYI